VTERSTPVASSTATLDVKARDVRGTRRCRRLRDAGEVPAVVYGHKEDPVPIQLRYEDLDAALRHHGRMFDLRLGDATERVLLKDVQYDALGSTVLHADFLRIAMDEKLTIEVPVETHGAIKQEHAVLQQTLDTVEVECLPADIPESITIEVAGLEIGDSLHVSDLEAPEGVEIVTDPEVVVVSVTHAAAEEAEEEEAVPETLLGAAEEPEVIGAREEDEEAAEGNEGP
jgi:large subunit ribosomal protein L25